MRCFYNCIITTRGIAHISPMGKNKKNKVKARYAQYDTGTCRTYDVKGGTPIEAHGLFDGPDCMSTTIESHIKQMQKEMYNDALSASIPADCQPLFGYPNGYSPYGFKMMVKLYWPLEVPQANIDDFEWCMYQISPNRTADEESGQGGPALVDHGFYLERVYDEWVQAEELAREVESRRLHAQMKQIDRMFYPY